MVWLEINNKQEYIPVNWIAAIPAAMTILNKLIYS
jgi:hypothetical protein